MKVEHYCESFSSSWRNNLVALNFMQKLDEDSTPPALC